MSALEIIENLGSLQDIQTKQEELLKKRKEILKDLSRVEDEGFRAGNDTRPQVDGSDPTHVNESDFHQKKKIKLNDGASTTAVNKKLHSAISLVSSHGNNQDEKKGDSEFKIEKRDLGKKLPDDLQKRNRNLFGNMLGYLNKAKTTLESQKDLLKKQDDFVNKAESKNIEEASKLKEKHVKLLEGKREELIRDKIELEKEILKNDQERLIKMTEKHFSDISGYILTSHKPAIMWKPAKLNTETERLIFESKPSINKMKERALDFVAKSVDALKKQLESEQFQEHTEEKIEIANEKPREDKEKQEEEQDDRSKSSNESEDSDRD